MSEYFTSEKDFKNKQKIEQKNIKADKETAKKIREVIEKYSNTNSVFPSIPK